jgi:hypothetical protein
MDSRVGSYHRIRKISVFLFKKVLIENATMAMYSHAYPCTGYLIQVNSFQSQVSSPVCSCQLSARPLGLLLLVQCSKADTRLYSQVLPHSGGNTEIDQASYWPHGTAHSTSLVYTCYGTEYLSAPRYVSRYRLHFSQIFHFIDLIHLCFSGPYKCSGVMCRLIHRLAHCQ